MPHWCRMIRDSIKLIYTDLDEIQGAFGSHTTECTYIERLPGFGLCKAPHIAPTAQKPDDFPYNKTGKDTCLARAARIRNSVI